MQPPNVMPWSFCRHLAGVTSVRSADGDDFAPQLMIWAVFPAGMTRDDIPFEIPMEI